MADREELLRLASLCEAASGPDRELDAQVGRYFAADFLGTVPPEPQYGCVKFSASLDAAMTLVPVCPHTGGQKYAVRLDSGFYGPTAELWHECSSERFYGHASGFHEGLPLALAAASLRARAQDPLRARGGGE